MLALVLGTGVVATVVGAGVVVLVVEGTAVVFVIGVPLVAVLVAVPFGAAVLSSAVDFEDVVRFVRFPLEAPCEALSMSVPSTVGVAQATTVHTAPARRSQPPRRA